MSELPDRWLSVDPGETTGYACWEGNALVASGQAELWQFVDAFSIALFHKAALTAARDVELLRRVASAELLVLEDWHLYADKAQKLIGDKQDTVRGLGALQLAARAQNIPYTLQPAAIKDAACQAGAREFFNRPLYPNRHSNDAIMHGVYYAGMQGKGVVQEG